MKKNEKNLLRLIVVSMFCMFVFNGQAQRTTTKKSIDLIISTSAECNQCKKRLEEKLNYTKGVRYAELDVPSRKLTVRYIPSKISDGEIRNLIAKIGYDADDVLADPTAQKALPKCCQPGGMHSHDH